MTSSEACPSAEAEGREQQATAPRGHGWVGPYQILGGKCAPELSDTLALFPSYELDLGRGCHVCGHQDGGADQAGTFEHFGLNFLKAISFHMWKTCVGLMLSMAVDYSNGDCAAEPALMQLLHWETKDGSLVPVLHEESLTELAKVTGALF